MRKHGVNVNPFNTKIRGGTLVLEQCFPPLGFTSCFLACTILIPLSENHEQQMLLSTCSKLPGSSPVLVVEIQVNS